MTVDAAASIESDRRYEFEHDRSTVWAALTSVDSYQQWWPWLRDFDGASFDQGASWRCTVKPPLPYSLTFHVTLIEVVEGRLARAELSGDISGTATLDLADIAAGSELRLRSSLAAAGGPARFVARFARPIASIGHDWIVDTGARQFRQHALAPPDNS